MAKSPELGDKVRDLVSGFEGIVTSRTEWLNGCVRLGVAPQKLKEDGEPITAQVFDVEQLEVLKGGVRLAQAEKQEPKAPLHSRSGGDRETISRAPSPQR